MCPAEPDLQAVHVEDGCREIIGGGSAFTSAAEAAPPSLRRGDGDLISAAEAGVEGVAEGVAEEIEGQAEDADGDGGGHGLPPDASQQLQLGVVDHAAPTGAVGDAES